ncbi:MAG: NUDIX domain-containing protein [Candidatus Aenigmatarchaeota archaeon]|nr:MAG: NUDIX domain-containing protein [Candidatus Aenigmarchaeota archaeon]
MKFRERLVDGLRTPVLVAEGFEIQSVTADGIGLRQQVTGAVTLEEPLFAHGKDAVFPRAFKGQLANDSVIVLLFTNRGTVFLQRRGLQKKWEPGKIDLASVAGQRAAVLIADRYEPEPLESTAFREVAEETGVSVSVLRKDPLRFIGEHYNPRTNEFQTVYACVLDVTMAELNAKLSAAGTGEVDAWIEKDYGMCIAEYFGALANNYAGGESMRPVNFIANPAIRRGLDSFASGLSILSRPVP